MRTGGSSTQVQVPISYLFVIHALTSQLTGIVVINTILVALCLLIKIQHRKFQCPFGKIIFYSIHKQQSES